MNKTNEKYTIVVESPLLRPGLKISAAVSSKYVSSTVEKLLNLVREINQHKTEKTIDFGSEQ